MESLVTQNVIYASLCHMIAGGWIRWVGQVGGSGGWDSRCGDKWGNCWEDRGTGGQERGTG